MTAPARILVTGDVVLDCHLYGGVKTAATSFREPGTEYTQRLGGAALTHELILAAADSKGLDWDTRRQKWEEENARRQKDGKPPLPRPDNLEENRPLPAFETHFDLDTNGLQDALPKHLRSYGVWTDKPTRKNAKDNERVWRVERHFGYGRTKAILPGGIFKRSRTRPNGPLMFTLIDDGGILFRHEVSRGAWPDLSGESSGYYLLKMSWPLCRGDLWAALTAVANRLIVVVSAIDLRREDIQINSRFSWEQCVEHTISALQNDPIARELLQAAHVVVSFRSAGALWIERQRDAQPYIYRLVFDPAMLEGDYSLRFDGTAYGFQTCLAAGIAHHLMQRHALADGKKALSPFVHHLALEESMLQGITSGLLARRLLLELGHGPIDRPEPGFPIKSLGRAIASSLGGLVPVVVPSDPHRRSGCQWTILGHSQTLANSTPALPEPLSGLAKLTARYGLRALSHVPSLRLGSLFTVDRSEIESFRALEALIRSYETTKVQQRPLSIGVFGPPGAGKSFGVKAVAKAILSERVPFLEFNLSQFKSPEELIGAFHRVRDAVLTGITPVAFWDEFDSQDYKWLQYLLAPMQDGTFQEGQITHPIGKCVFVFAGGTSHTLEEFGIAKPSERTQKHLAALSKEECTEERQVSREESERFRTFKLLKGPDFISRLHGFLNVLGPNSRTGTKCPDITWPIRRAIILRGVLGLSDDEELDIDPGLLNALLNVPDYRHGARSLEKILNTLLHDRHYGRLHRSALPPQPLLDRETVAEELHRLLIQGDASKAFPDLEALAAAVHHNFLDQGQKSQIKAQMKANPHLAWTIHPSIQTHYDQLPPNLKASNRAAARRIPDHLALIGYTVESQSPRDDGSWKAPLEASIERHLDLLAQAEHLGWWAERNTNGWVFAEERNNDLKHHPSLVPWARLSPRDQDKDRASARSIPQLLEIAKFKAVPVRNLP